MDSSGIGRAMANEAAKLVAFGIIAGIGLGAILFKFIPWLWAHININWVG